MEVKKWVPMFGSMIRYLYWQIIYNRTITINKGLKKITTEFIKEFIETNEIPLVASQTKLCIPIIDRMCRKMSHGIKFDDIKICDNLVIDGHHRYLSSLIVDFNIGQIFRHKTTATKPVEWKIIEFDENDWDTSSKISHLNEQDATYNGLDIEFVKQIILR